MESSVVVLVAALIAVFLAWKLLKGIVKTVALVAILVVGGLIVFGGMS